MVVAVGQVAGEAENQGAVAGVTLAGKGQRAVQTGTQVCRCKTLLSQLTEDGGIPNDQVMRRL